MKKEFHIFPKGLAGKLIRAVVFPLLALGVVIIIITVGQVHVLEHITGEEGEKLTKRIGEESRDSMEALTEQGLLELSVVAADKTDDELWVNGYELDIMAAQVTEVLTHPENYGRVPVNPPEKENAGELTLQLLAPDGYDNISPETMETMERLANLAPIMKTYIGNYTLDCYIATPDGTTLCMDRFSDDKFEADGSIKSYDATTRPWFQESVKKKGLYFTPAVHSFFYDYDIVAYGLPVYVDGKLAAVLEGSLNLEALRERVNSVKYGDMGFNILISKEGQLVSTTRTEGELAMRPDLSEDIRGSVNPGLNDLIDHGLAGESGTSVVEVDGEEYYAGFGPLVTPEWTQIAFIPKQQLLEPTEQLMEDTVAYSGRMKEEFSRLFHRNIIIMLIVLAVIIEISIILVSQLTKKRMEPIKRIAEKVEKFTEEDMTFAMEEDFKTGDEIQVLAESFEEMSVKMKQYVREIVAISTEKEHIDAEMKMATQIQESMLPRKFPAFPDRSEFDLYANMVPAKNVGGDFYDFFFVDEDHLALVMADVSGKGVTAALFMALSKQVIQSRLLLQGGEVSEAITAANLQLIEESLEDMFVTVWLGVVTISTGKLVFVDAGHEYPAFRRGGGAFVIEEDNHSMALAAVDFAKYHTNELTLKPGDMLFLYTDGIPEAHNSANEMFEMERLTQALNEKKEASLKEQDDFLRQRVAEFAGDAEQFDDITTLWFRYLGPKESNDPESPEEPL